MHARGFRIRGPVPELQECGRSPSGAIEGGADAVGAAMTVLMRMAEGFSLLYQKKTISLDLTLQLRQREAEVIGLLVAGAIAEADVSRILEGARYLSASSRPRSAHARQPRTSARRRKPSSASLPKCSR